MPQINAEQAKRENNKRKLTGSEYERKRNLKRLDIAVTNRKFSCILQAWSLITQVTSKLIPGTRQRLFIRGHKLEIFFLVIPENLSASP